MRVILLGTGTPYPSAARMATANLVEAAGARILVDAGRGASVQLVRAGLHPRDVGHIFLTHHHFDHIAGLGDVLLSAWNDGRTAPVALFGPVGTAALLAHLFAIYARDIDFRLREARAFGHEMPDLRDLVSVCEIAPGETVTRPGWTVRAEAVEHGGAMLGYAYADWPCLGYRLEAEGRALAISGDCIDCAGVRSLAQGADLLLQCCYMARAEIDGPERRMLAEGVLADAAQAAAIARAAGVGRMALTHLAPKSDAMLAEVLREASEGVAAEVLLGADLMALEV